VDLVTVSVAGEPETHGRLRDGSDLERVVALAGALAGSLGRRGRVQLSYLLTRDSAGDLPSLVERAAGAGVREIFVTHLDITPAGELLRRAAFAGDALAPGIADALHDAAGRAHRRRIRLRGPPLHPRELLVCALDPTRLAFVARDGRVGPCVALLMPLVSGGGGAIPRATASEEPVSVEPISYGRLQEHRLAELLAGSARRNFVGPFEARLEAERRFLSSITEGFGVEALRQVDEADARRLEALAVHPFPPACAGCHKARGW
jgi:hypothetical protein